MMKKKKSELDEMQEKKLLKIEHHTLILMEISLFAALLLQQAFWGGNVKATIGETVVLLISGVYMIVQCIRNGIWGIKEFNAKTNVLISGLTGLGIGIFWGVTSYVKYRALAGAVAVFVYMSILMFVVLNVMFSGVGVLYRRKKERLEKQADEDEKAE